MFCIIGETKGKTGFVLGMDGWNDFKNEVGRVSASRVSMGRSF
jgi:hypothetical protein